MNHFDQIFLVVHHYVDALVRAWDLVKNRFGFQAFDISSSIHSLAAQSVTWNAIAVTVQTGISALGQLKFGLFTGRHGLASLADLTAKPRPSLLKGWLRPGLNIGKRLRRLRCDLLATHIGIGVALDSDDLLVKVTLNLINRVLSRPDLIEASLLIAQPEAIGVTHVECDTSHIALQIVWRLSSTILKVYLELASTVLRSRPRNLIIPEVASVSIDLSHHGQEVMEVVVRLDKLRVMAQAVLASTTRFSFPFPPASELATEVFCWYYVLDLNAAGASFIFANLIPATGEVNVLFGIKGAAAIAVDPIVTIGLLKQLFSTLEGVSNLNISLSRCCQRHEEKAE